MTRTALIFLDTETTGLRPDIHCPWEIAWVTAVHDTERGVLMEVSRRHAFVELDEMQQANADPFALQVGGYQDRYIETDSVVYTDVVDQLNEDIWFTRCVAVDVSCEDFDGVAPPPPPIHLVGAIPSFDHAMICQQWIGWPGFGEGLWHYHLIDIEALAVGYINGRNDGERDPYPEFPPVIWPVRSDDIGPRIGIPPVEEALRHTAMGDALHAQTMYRMIYDLDQTVWVG